MKKNEKIIIALLFLICIVSCSSTVIDSKNYRLYQSIHNKTESKKLESITNKQLINQHKDTAIELIVNKRKRRSFFRTLYKITPSDDYANFGDFSANYKMFSFNIEKKINYILNIRIITDNYYSGFFERIFYHAAIFPYILIFDERGNLITSQTYEYDIFTDYKNEEQIYIKKQNYIETFGLQDWTDFNIKLSNLPQGKYYLVLAPDTTHLNKDIYTNDKFVARRYDIVSSLLNLGRGRVSEIFSKPDPYGEFSILLKSSKK